MGGRGSSTFQKRQKELKRREKQMQKMARRHERSQEDASNPSEEKGPEIDWSAQYHPENE